MRSQAQSSYHHGALRTACIDAGLRRLREKGVAALSLREIAREAGVSPRAPYRHFLDKTDLLAAIAEVGFIRFRDALRKALMRPGTHDPRRRLGALASAYVAFALANSDLIRLMFGNYFPNRRRRFPSLDRVALDSFSVLRQEIQSASKLPPTRATPLAVAAWASIHGLSELLIEHQLEHLELRRKEIEKIQTMVVEVFYRGSAR